MRHAVVLLLLAGLVGPARAQSFNAVTDFSLASNPNGAWSYGSAPRSGGALTLYATATPNVAGVSGLNQWNSDGSVLFPPFVVGNSSGMTLGDIFGIQLPPTLLLVHPSIGTNTVVRWTAPSAGTYSVSGHFDGIDLTGTTTSVYVVVNGTAAFSAAVAGFGATAPFSIPSVSLGAGDHVDFVVDADGPCGGDGSCGDGQAHDSTGLAVTVSDSGGCSPPQAPVGIDSTGALGLYEGDKTGEILIANERRIATLDIKPATIVAPIIGSTSITLWGSIDDIVVSDPVAVTITPNHADVVGATFAQLRLVPPGSHASFSASFCRPGRVDFRLGFNAEAGALTIADVLVSGLGGKLNFILGQLTPGQIAAFTSSLGSIPLYAAATAELSSAVSAIASGNQKEALSHAGAAGQDLVRLAVNSNQRSQLLSAFGLLGFKVTLSGLFRALVGAPLRLVRIISDTIVLVAATNFGSSPIVITAWAPF